MGTNFRISSPKRDTNSQSGWEAFFPYYAGYSETFARGLLESAQLPGGAIVWDPWNGSGTTTFAASQLGLASIGFDLNPVMVIIARARNLALTEADSLSPLAEDILISARRLTAVDAQDPLNDWFTRETTIALRSIERSIRKRLVGALTQAKCGVDLSHLSSIAATFYVALFAVGRTLTRGFRSTNPTWTKKPKSEGERLAVERYIIESAFRAEIDQMAGSLAASPAPKFREHADMHIRLADSTTTRLAPSSIDLVLSSPPYCTRIDYTSATRIELAFTSGLIGTDFSELSRQMIGSVRVPIVDPVLDRKWGKACGNFLEKVQSHNSKASAGYYYRTHLDYFNKMSLSLRSISSAVKLGGNAFLVVQDSYYKDVHNDLPAIISEMATLQGFSVLHREDFHSRRSMSGINPYVKGHGRRPGAVESVLCLEKTQSVSSEKK